MNWSYSICSDHTRGDALSNLKRREKNRARRSWLDDGLDRCFETKLFRSPLILLQPQRQHVQQEGAKQDDAGQRFLEVDADVRQQVESVGQDREDQQSQHGIQHAPLTTEERGAAQ